MIDSDIPELRVLDIEKVMPRDAYKKVPSNVSGPIALIEKSNNYAIITLGTLNGALSLLLMHW